MALCQLSANLVTDISARTTRLTMWVSIFLALLGKLYQTHVNVSITRLIFYQVLFHVSLFS